MSNKFEFGSWPSDEVDDDAIEQAIEQALQDAARKGLIVDSGRRRWSERTRSYQIVWVSRIYDPNRQKKLN
jgi:hypothetical protein